jgi:DNA-binding transcriptional LysR family regulator
MTLSPAGDSMLHHARMMLSNVEKIAIELSEYAQGIRGHVRMLANLSAIIQFLPEDLRRFFDAHTLLRFDLQERPSTGVIHGIAQDAADIGICFAEVATRGLASFPYRRDHLVLVVPAHHPLAERSAIHFIDTLDFEHITLHTATSIYLRSQYTANQAGKVMRVRVHVPGFDAVCRMVQAGMGIGIVPDRAFDVLSEGMNLRSIPLLDPWAERELKIVVRDPERLSATSRLMFDYLTAAEQREVAPAP